MTRLTRRGFISATGASIAVGASADTPETRRLFGAIGITAKIQRAAELKALGAEFIVESVAEFLVPFAPDADFAAHADLARVAALPVRGCNSFLRDPSLICVGPKADHNRVLSYAEVAFRRLRVIGGEYIVFGSNSARRIPEGWNTAKADEQMIAVLRAMGPLAQRHGITVALESLRAQECNYLNHIDEVVSVIRQVAHPHIRVLADLFHMRVMGDTPEQLAAAMPWVGLVEVAERDNRTVPGVAGDDFTPFFQVLARHGYRGLVDIEADGDREQLRKAFSVIAAQASKVMRDPA